MVTIFYNFIIFMNIVIVNKETVFYISIIKNYHTVTDNSIKNLITYGRFEFQVCAKKFIEFVTIIVIPTPPTDIHSMFSKQIYMLNHECTTSIEHAYRFRLMLNLELTTHFTTNGVITLPNLGSRRGTRLDGCTTYHK